MIATELAARYVKGESKSALAREYGMDWHTVRDILAAMGMERGGRTVRQVVTQSGHCRRCAILLAQAPIGYDGWCGWCVEEVR